MTRKKISTNIIAIWLLGAAFTEPSVIHSFTITSNLMSPNTLVAKNIDTGISGFRSSKRQSRVSPTATYSRSTDVQTGELNEINIDDVLLEAENALKFAQSSLVDEEDDEIEKTMDFESKADLRDIDINDVLLEAEKALNVAQTSLVDVDGDANKKNGDGEFEIIKDALRDSLLSNDVEDKASVELTEILSSTIGGIVLGSLLGSVATFRLSDLSSLSLGSASFSSDAIQFAIPIIASVILGGIAGFAGSLQDNTLGTIIRNVLGVPTRALASAIVSSIQEAASRQVEKTTNEIKSIPSNVANSAKQKAAQKAREAKLAVDMAIDMAIESLIEELKKAILVLAILSSLVAVGVLLTNGQTIAEIFSQLF